jgi:hypothetical protein
LRKGKQKQLKLYKQNDSVLNVAGKFSQTRNASALSAELMQSALERLNLAQLDKRAIKLLNDKKLEVSKV